MPRGVEGAHQPTIAVIASQYFEKMAVDAMMTNKQTFMRYATVGKNWLEYTVDFVTLQLLSFYLRTRVLCTI